MRKRGRKKLNPMISMVVTDKNKNLKKNIIVVHSF